MRFLSTQPSWLLLALTSPAFASDSAVANAGSNVARAAPNSPSGNYAPKAVDCPSERPVIRSAASLSDSEKDWLEQRRPKTLDPMKAFFKNSGLSDFDAEAYLDKHAKNFSIIPNIALAASGGGYRALMNGAGFIASADARVPGSLDKGGLGNLLQASTYIAGLSGGGWLVGSIFANNFSTVVDLRDSPDNQNTWQFANSIFEGPTNTGLEILDIPHYYDDLVDSVDEKSDAGYEVSLTDTWGRALSYQLIGDEKGGPAYTFSSIADADHFANADTPMPFLVAVGEAPDSPYLTYNNTVYEFNPFEIGTHDPTVYGFGPLRYLGSNFSDGTVPKDGKCVRGYDQYGFVMGTSSSLFNSFLLQNISSEAVPDIVADSVNSILASIASADWDEDVAVYSPNPWKGYNSETNEVAKEDDFILVDGGLGLENIPYQPLIQPKRNVDVIFSVDSSADNEFSWPNGTALRATYERSQHSIANGTNFPKVPDAETFINLGLNNKPTFFGCDTSEFEDGHIPPLVVYLPNTPYTAWSNVSTFDPSYSNTERNNIIQNGWNSATMGNNTVDDQWTTCAACAVLSRSLERTDTPVPASCKTCFDRHCWNGTTDSREVKYEPEPILALAADNSSGKVGASPQMWFLMAIAGLSLLL